jgi:GrpE
MPDRAVKRVPALLVAVALLPAAVLAGVVLLQSSELTAPAVSSRCAHAAACVYRALTDVADKRSIALAYGWVGAGLLLVLGVVLAALLSRRIGRPATTSPAPRAGSSTDHDRERAALVKACVNVSDLVTGAPREQLVDALIEAGVNPIEVPAGERFDSSRHHAVGRVLTSDRSLHNLVAEMERAGYVDHGRRLRYPDVLVWAAGGGAPS